MYPCACYADVPLCLLCRWTELAEHPWTEIRTYDCRFGGVRTEPLVDQHGVQEKWADGTLRTKFEAGFVTELDEFAAMVEADMLRHIRIQFADRMAAAVLPHNTFAMIEVQACCLDLQGYI